jgi:hypothetical protein
VDGAGIIDQVDVVTTPVAAIVKTVAVVRISVVVEIIASLADVVVKLVALLRVTPNIVLVPDSLRSVHLSIFIGTVCSWYGTTLLVNLKTAVICRLISLGYSNWRELHTPSLSWYLEQESIRPRRKYNAFGFLSH